MATITTLLPGTPSNVMPYPMEDSTIAIGHAVTANAILLKGTAVKLNSDGTVSAITAVSDLYYGTVYKSNKLKGNGYYEKAIIQTRFKFVVIGTADVAIATGGIVDAESFDATTGFQDYKATAGGGNKVGMAIAGGADNATVMIGIY